jgi:hypothetical protein
MSESPGLFEIPTEWLVPPPRTLPPPDGKVRWSRWKSKTRTLCHDCVLAIHQQGQQGAAYPRVAHWKLMDDQGMTLLCSVHRQERQEGDR